MKTLVQWRAVFQGLLILALTAYASVAWNVEVQDVAALHTSVSGDFDSLRGLLESRGWQVERTSDGSTLLIPLRTTAEAQNQALPVQPDLITAVDVDRLRGTLEARGWRVEPGADGSLLLIPATRSAPREPVTATPLKSIRLTVSPEDMPQLKQLLEDYHWTLRQDNNTLRLSPPTHTRATSTSTTADRAEEHQESSLTAGVTLPVNTKKEAWQISVNWLWESGYTDLTVGRIRAINWFYLVTIVDARPPYRPRNELIINKRTGQLLASF